MNGNVSTNIGTFEVSVKFTKNSTWQGRIHWVEKNVKQNFRSALEMLRLMDEALSDGDETSNITWQENSTTI